MELEAEFTDAVTMAQRAYVFLAGGNVFFAAELLFEVELVEQVPRLVALLKVHAPLLPDGLPYPLFVVGVTRHARIRVEIRVLLKDHVVQVLSFEAEGVGLGEGAVNKLAV